MKISKYLEDNQHRVNVKKNNVYKISSLTQLKKDNQVALTLVKDVYIHKRFKHINVTCYRVRDLYAKN